MKANNGHIAAGNYLFEEAQARYCCVAIHDVWIAEEKDHWGREYAPQYKEDLRRARAALVLEAEWYQEQSELFLNNRPPPKPDIGERPALFPPYQEGMIWVTDKYPDGIPARVVALRHAWNLCA